MSFKVNLSYQCEWIFSWPFAARVIKSTICLFVFKIWTKGASHRYFIPESIVLFTQLIIHALEDYEQQSMNPFMFVLLNYVVQHIRHVAASPLLGATINTFVTAGSRRHHFHIWHHGKLLLHSKSWSHTWRNHPFTIDMLCFSYLIRHILE